MKIYIVLKKGSNTDKLGKRKDLNCGKFRGVNILNFSNGLSK